MVDDAMADDTVVDYIMVDDTMVDTLITDAMVDTMVDVTVDCRWRIGWLIAVAETVRKTMVGHNSATPTVHRSTATTFFIDIHQRHPPAERGGRGGGVHLDSPCM